MNKFYRWVAVVCWVLGLISLLESAVLRLIQICEVKVSAWPSGGLILAVALFLCVLASCELRKTAPSS
jgi:hypothetical protein